MSLRLRAVLTGLLAAVLCAVLAAAPLAIGSSAVPDRRAPADGALVTPKGVYYPDGGQKRLDFAFSVREFSPDGTRVIGIGPDGGLVVQDNNGSMQQYPATWQGDASDVIWSPDQTRAAVVTTGAIYGYSLITQGSTLLFQSSASLRLDQAGVSWSPDGTKIAFIGTNPLGQDVMQVYVVPAGGGPPTLYALPPNTGSHQHRFSNPDWAPDGSRIAALVAEFGSDSNGSFHRQFIGTLSAGSSAEPGVIKVTDPLIGSGYSADRGPLWSSDGSRILYGQGVPGAENTLPTIIAANTGQVVATVPKAVEFRDWQPCPTGSCAIFRDPPAERRVIFKTSAKKIAKGKKVVFHGNLRAQFDRCTQNQAFRLERAVGRKGFKLWKSLRTDDDGRYVLRKKARKTAKYRVVVPSTADCLEGVSETRKVKVTRR